MKEIEFISVLTDIQKQKKNLEFELEMAMQKVISDWQNKTGLSISEVKSSFETVNALGEKSRSILTNVDVILNYEV